MFRSGPKARAGQGAGTRVTTTPHQTTGSSPDRPGPSERAPGAEGLSLAARALAHEAKNALNTIVLKVELLLGTPGDPAGAADAHLGAIRDAARRLDGLIRRFVDFADPAGGPSADAGSAASEVAALLAPEARRRGIELAVAPAPDGRRARVPPAALNDLLLGLVARAVAATPGGGRVVLRTGERSGSVEVVLERGAVEPGADPGHPSDRAAAEALGGTLWVEREGTVERILVVLPGEP